MRFVLLNESTAHVPILVVINREVLHSLVVFIVSASTLRSSG